MAALMHVNTLEVPVYWEQLEPREGQFDDSVVDNVVQQARAHHVRLILLWFATWKNGKMHYAPEWVKSDTKRFPRMIAPAGLPIDVLSPNSPANYNADAAAFAHLMAHLRQIDGTQHTVIMMQLENEPGALGAVRDFSPMAQKQFEANVPPELAQALHKPAGNWKKLFGDDADETFAAYATANYIDKVAEAGKKQMALPMYVNNWLKSPRAYPVSTIPGVDYPSGGPTYNMLDIWKAAGPHINVIAPDIHVPGVQGFKNVMQQYTRPDNPLFIPETDGYGATRGNDGRAASSFSPWARAPSASPPSASTASPSAPTASWMWNARAWPRTTACSSPPERSSRRCSSRARCRPRSKSLAWRRSNCPSAIGLRWSASRRPSMPLCRTTAAHPPRA